MIRKLIGWPVAQALYYLGHWASLILNRLPSMDTEQPSCGAEALLAIYNGCMVKSMRVNDWAGLSIWTVADAPAEGDSRG